MNQRFLLVPGLLLLGLHPAAGQYQLEKAVVASGGGDLSGGTYTATATIGQPAADGFLSAPPYQVYAGFWTPPYFAPTAAGVTATGRARTARGRPISNAVVSLIDASGRIQSIRTSAFGFFRFVDLVPGQTYIFTIEARRYTFEQRSQMVMVMDDLSGVEFIGSP